MAKKISQLTQATEVKSDDVTVIVQDGETKKLPLNMMVTKQDIENKKTAGLAKLDEIETTYENDTYTPTITVKNKSSVKTGEGDEVDYSANVMDGHAKSAILKGCTLVNISIIKEYSFSSTQIQIKCYNNETIKTNTEYTIIYDITDTNNLGSVMLDCFGNTPLPITLGRHKIKFSTLTSLKNNSNMYISGGFVGVVDNIMIIEGDYINVDIPYFTGMQSVKMPVLTTTGKNLIKGIQNDSTLFDNKDVFSVRPVQNESNTIKLEEPIILNEEYTLSFNVMPSNNGYLLLVPMYDDGTNGERIGNWDSVNGWTKKEYNLPKNGKRMIGFTFIMSSNNNYVYVEKNTIQLEQGTQATPYEPYKSNILSTPEDLELRGIGKIKDELNVATGELTQRIGEVVLDGSEKFGIEEFADTGMVYAKLLSHQETVSEAGNIICNNFIGYQTSIYGKPLEGVYFVDGIKFMIKKDKLSEVSSSGVSKFLSDTGTIVQYKKPTESVKTVDLIPSGTHPSTTPYCWKNGHIQLSSSGLLPNLEYSVVTSRAGQINQNATMIVKNDKRIFDLEILLAGGLVNTTYQALTLQNQVETGLSKVSLNSETEPDYLLYHMIMKLIEEKAYKLDDLTEKVSVFYLYEKLSDEQFETIYSALYPFAEDEIIEEPVVEELPEVVEDEVIM